MVENSSLQGDSVFWPPEFDYDRSGTFGNSEFRDAAKDLLRCRIFELYGARLNGVVQLALKI